MTHPPSKEGMRWHPKAGIPKFSVRHYHPRVIYCLRRLSTILTCRTKKKRRKKIRIGKLCDTEVWTSSSSLCTTGDIQQCQQQGPPQRKSQLLGKRIKRRQWRKSVIPSSSSSVQCCLAEVASFSLSWDVEDVSVSSPAPKETSLEAVWLGTSLASPSLSNLSLFTSCPSASAGSSSECLFFTGLLWAPSDSDAGDSL